MHYLFNKHTNLLFAVVDGASGYPECEDFIPHS
jgi:hypothetical protein